MIALPFQLFAVLCGVIEAVLYCRRGAESFTHNEHVEMTLQRISVAVLVLAGALAYRWHGSVAMVAAELLPAVLLFPLFHDEAYNFTRLWLREAEKAGTTAGAVIGIFPTWALRLLPTASHDGRAFCRALSLYCYGYQSPTTTARNDFSGRQRTVLAAVGAALLIGLYALYLLS
ncbi:hypothetical protein LJ737_19820 [Hymenobacter sp. 15J16-1T3B]|uniref:hypothetical protein n=1 Tax=Hymenobacter sp. 15J16-1T3B TaxID=2886941 RepID=UPI001D0FADF4|nr:hypothetical protein [Hymenobacter sp. 15J16-1T3B]MCC3159500.1 hypothetical protein [Hymenobacter sp. 15J16-1T3B]